MLDLTVAIRNSTLLQICSLWNTILYMEWMVEFTDEFGDWWDTLTESMQGSIEAYVEKLEQMGPNLPFPYSSGVSGSRHSHMRELRVQSGGRPLRIFYAFDHRRMAILLIGGDKSGEARFYARYVPIADALYDEHLRELAQENDHGR
jgi:hypothetical protein